MNMEVKRATFEQVYKAQNDFIFGETGIDKLAELEETVSPDSRQTYFENLAISLIGLGLKYRFILKYLNNRYDLGPLSIFARKMAYMVGTPDKKQLLSLKGKEIRVPIKILWNSLRENMYEPMDEALTLSLKTSAEILKNSGGSYEFNPNKKQ